MKKLLILLFILTACGGGDSGDTFTISGESNDVTIIQISDSDIIQACASLVVNEGIDCYSKDSQTNCAQCFSESFRAELGDLSIESCFDLLAERDFCEG